MKANLSSFGLALSEKTESQDAFAVQTWNELVIAVMADGVARDTGRRVSGTPSVSSRAVRNARTLAGISLRAGISTYTFSGDDA